MTGGSRRLVRGVGGPDHANVLRIAMPWLETATDAQRSADALLVVTGECGCPFRDLMTWGWLRWADDEAAASWQPGLPEVDGDS
jgi:hypothetical protein